MRPATTTRIQPANLSVGKTREPPHAGSAVVESSKESRCKAIADQIERINTRMRDPYTAAEGEWYRERLRKLDDQRWDANCRSL
jgi:hypothetical protein